MKPLLAIWNLAHFGKDHGRPRNYRAETRHEMRARMRCAPSGKGNKAWKRFERQEQAWRASGGFYLADLIP